MDILAEEEGIPVAGILAEGRPAADIPIAGSLIEEEGNLAEDSPEEEDSLDSGTYRKVKEV